MRDSSPYKTIAVATTFSPRFKRVLAEAKRIRDRFGAELHLIHVGKRNQETPKKFSDVLAELELPADSPIHYEEGDPAEAILAALARENIDVLVAGALEKEIVLHPFLGNVARRLVREANCSVMLFTNPRKKSETAAPHRIHCRPLTAGIGGVENDADAGGSRIMRATVRDWNHHCV